MRGFKVINVKKTLHAKEQCERIAFITHLLLLLMLSLTPTPTPLSPSHPFAEGVGLHTVASFTREREITNFLQMEILWMWTSRALGSEDKHYFKFQMERVGLIQCKVLWWLGKPMVFQKSLWCIWPVQSNMHTRTRVILSKSLFPGSMYRMV